MAEEFSRHQSYQQGIQDDEYECPHGVPYDEPCELCDAELEDNEDE